MATTTGAFSNVMQRNTADRREERKAMRRQGVDEYTNVGGSERLASAVAGGLLALWGFRRRGTFGYGAAALGAELLYRGVSGHCVAYSAMGISTNEARPRDTRVDIDHSRSVDVRHAIHVARPRDELYAIWRDFSTLPQFMDHLARVEVITPTVSHWVTKGPAGTSVEWDMEIVDEQQGEWIAWRSKGPTEVPNRGTVMFREAAGGGTEIFVTLEAEPPAGKVGDLVARMFGRSPDRQVRRALERFKDMAESGHQFGERHPSQTDREVGLSHTGLSDLPHRSTTKPDGHAVKNVRNTDALPTPPSA